jgi:hypothetical protein
MNLEHPECKPLKYTKIAWTKACHCVKKMNHITVMLRVLKSFGWGGILAGSVAVFAQNSATNPVVPQGVEFSILGSLPGDQVWPSISLSPAASLIAWQDNVIDKKGAGIGGAMLGAGFVAQRKFTANKTATGDQLNPRVQLLANDNAIFVWQSGVGATPGIYARMASGTSKKIEAYGTNFYTSDTRVNTYTKDQVADPAVAALPDGSAIIAWSSYGEDGSLWGVFARKLSAKGAASPSKDIPVNQYTLYNQRKPAVATLANGDFVICWVSEQERAYNSVDIYARVFTAAGTPDTSVNGGDEIAINTATNFCDTPDVAPLSDGGFTVVWAQKDALVATNGWDVWGRAFSASGTPAVADFRINTFLYGDQYRPKIAAGPSGSLVVWTSLAQDGSREGVFGRFLQAGTAVAGSEMLINTTTVSQQIHPAVAWNGVNNFLVVWTSFVGASGFDLYGQAYTLNTSQ